MRSKGERTCFARVVSAVHSVGVALQPGPRTRTGAVMPRLIGSPLRNMGAILGFLLMVVVTATLGYMMAGWSFTDAFYMVMLTVYTVGFEEVRPINTPFLHALTLGVMFLGCTGMILMTGALVQLFTATEIRNLLGTNRVKSDIDRLNDHVIICGFGRIGAMLARELAAGEAKFLVLERDPQRVEQAGAHGYLAMAADATDEAMLVSAGIERARALATVLPDDAANVFITLSARNLNPRLQIISRGEAPSTERKLRHAGADMVILPAHIGAERIAELLLYPEASSLIRGSRRMRDVERSLHDIGMEIEVVAVGQTASGLTVEALESRAPGCFFVARIDRGGEIISRPEPGALILQGDGLIVVGRSPAAVTAALEMPE